MRVRFGIFALAVLAIVGSIIYLERQKVADTGDDSGTIEVAPAVGSADTKQKESLYPRAKEITSPDGFINTDPMTIAGLVGKKIILIDFWTYSCINCQRTTPYLNAWYEKYKDQGLEIVGVHTPEFEFEKKYSNVQAAVEKFKIRYPVVLDNDYSTWRAYENNYWPRKYLIDIDGFIIYDHIGEGAYKETERALQKALAERKDRMGEVGDINTDVAVPREAEVSFAQSPEIYFGALRNNLSGGGASGSHGQQTFDEPAAIEPNTLYLVGDWIIGDEYAIPAREGAKIIFKYHAKKVFTVAGSPQPAGLYISLDGEPAGLYCDGASCRAEGAPTVEVGGEGLYTLTEHAAAGEHTLEITIDTPGVQFFTLTFG